MKKIMVIVIGFMCMASLAFAALSNNQQYNSNIEQVVNVLIARHNAGMAELASYEQQIAAYRTSLNTAGVNWSAAINYTSPSIAGVNWTSYGYGNP